MGVLLLKIFKMQGVAGLGKAGQGKAGHGKARQGEAGRGRETKIQYREVITWKPRNIQHGKMRLK